MTTQINAAIADLMGDVREGFPAALAAQLRAATQTQGQGAPETPQEPAPQTDCPTCRQKER